MIRKAIPAPLWRQLRRLYPMRLKLARWTREALRDEPELRLALQMTCGGLFLDVGANKGVWSQAAAPHFPQVHAFEPNRDLAEQMRRALARNVTVHHLALSDRSAEVDLHVPLSDGEQVTTRASLLENANGDLPWVRQSVHSEKLDNLKLEPIDVIKIDVEGHEMAVLRGAEETLRAQHPALIVEIEERHHPGSSEEIIAWTCALGYECAYYDARRGRILPYRVGTIASLQQLGTPSLQESKETDYINNFLFFPPSRPELRDRLRAI